MSDPHPLGSCNPDAPRAPLVTSLECEIRCIAATRLRADEASITLTTSLRCLGDNVTLPQLWLALEAEFDIDLDHRDVLRLQTLNDAVELVRAQLQQRPRRR